MKMIDSNEWAKGNSASLRSLPRLRLGHITADKKGIKDFPKSRQVGTSFIRKTLGVIAEFNRTPP